MSKSLTKTFKKSLPAVFATLIVASGITFIPSLGIGRANSEVPAQVYVSAAIRCVNNRWSAVSTSNQRPTGIKSITASGSQLSIYTDYTSYIGSVQVTSDEVYNAHNIRAGASVGVSNIVLKITRNGKLVSPNSVCDMANSNFWITGISGVR